MKKIRVIAEYKFDAFSEMVEFLKEDVEHRCIYYMSESYGAMDRLKYPKKSDAESFFLFTGNGTPSCEKTELEMFFDENDKPMDDAFAEKYDVSMFTGQEVREIER